MPALTKFLEPKRYVQYLRKHYQEARRRLNPNLRGAYFYPPGHYYSPLLDIASLPDRNSNMPYDGEELWENIDLQRSAQEAYYTDLTKRFPESPFPRHQTAGARYYWDNAFFKYADSYTLSGILRKEKPRQIVEVGSGFSSAVMLDTMNLTGQTAAFTFIEPDPVRLNSLLTEKDKKSCELIPKIVQEVPMSVFDKLEAQDILFIDSSHVAKVGSDVSFLFLKVLPRLKPGVFIHVHDIFYPNSYPTDWINMGWAWNESLFLRALLVNNPSLQITAFNSYAGHVFPELFRKNLPGFLPITGGSIWLKKV